MTQADLDTLTILRAQRDVLFDKQQDAWRIYQQAIRAQQALDRAIDRILEEDAAVTRADATNENSEAA